jgi:trigger factor
VKSVVETLNPTRVRLAVEVPFTELESNISSAYKRIASQVTVPGFRKGKVPPRVIDQRVGRPVVLEEAVNEAIPKIYTDAIRENDLIPLGQPDIDVSEFGDGQELKFSAEVSVKPTVELPEWEGLEVRVDDATVTDEDLGARVTTLQERFATLVGVERPAAEGDFVQIDLDARDNGEPVEGGQATGVSYQIGRGGMIDGLDEAATGLSAGESATFKTTLLGNQEGTEVECTVVVTAVKEQQLPELDDEFAQLASEFDTLEELKDDLRTQAENNARLEQAVSARDKVLDSLLDAAGDVPLPDELVNAQVEQHFQDGHGDDDHRAEFEENFRKNLKAQFVLDELVKTEEIEVAQEELTQYILQQAMQSRTDPNQLAQQIVESGNLPSVYADVARGKALALVVEKANVLDESGTKVELELLREDGSVAQPGEDDEIAPASTAGVAFADFDDAATEEAEAEADEAAMVEQQRADDEAALADDSQDDADTK